MLRLMSGEPDGKKTTIMVVDDFTDGREMFAEYLEFVGFDVVTAKDGNEAIAMARGSKPDVILMDLSLPLLDGWEATRILKGDDETKHIKVVALTGHVMGAHQREAAEAGCDDFVSKPAIPQEVEVKIRALLKGKGPLKP